MNCSTNQIVFDRKNSKYTKEKCKTYSNWSRNSGLEFHELVRTWIDSNFLKVTKCLSQIQWVKFLVVESSKHSEMFKQAFLYLSYRMKPFVGLIMKLSLKANITLWVAQLCIAFWIHFYSERASKEVFLLVINGTKNIFLEKLQVSLFS